MTKLDKAISKILFECLNIGNQDTLLIIVDELTHGLGHKFFKKATSSKVDTSLLEIPLLNGRNTEPASMIQKLITQVSSVLVLTSKSLIHSKLVRTACHNGAKIICVHTILKNQIERAVNVDYDFIVEKSRRLADILSIGKEIHLTAKNGTDVTFRIGRHKSNINTGIARQPGDFGILPAGEAYITPDKNSTNGVIFIDGSTPPLGLINDPVEINIKDGYAAQILGNEEAEVVRKAIKSFGRNGRNIAEFGIGTNPGARFSGKSIEDEKVLGSAHIALGHHLYEGGSLKKNLHLDFILKKPTVEVDGHFIVKNGKLVF